MIAGINGSGSVTSLYPQYNITPVNKISSVEPTDEIKTSSKGECETCNNRRYVDGSNEGNVSFKTPGHISPESSANVVAAHEQEHVANAINEGNKEGNRLISASVSLQTAICPECGRSYVAGGVTSTTIAYNESNPYERNRKTIEGSFLKGMNVDLVA